MLYKGCYGEEVKLLQQKLIEKGYSCGASGVDGDFGQATYNAVISFQQANGLQVDGIVGNETWGALNSSNKENKADKEGVKRFVQIAVNEIGTREKNVNMTKYGQWFGSDGNEWCAIFVSWCAYKAGILYSLVPKYDWCEYAYNWYKARGNYKEKQSGYIPKPGDVIFFHNGDSFYHTGIVEYVRKNETIYSIEGNVSNSVCRIKHSVLEEKIHGYGVNNFK